MSEHSKNKIQASCLILAGGSGQRLTPEKPLLKIKGIPIIQRVVNVVTPIFAEVLIITNTPERYRFLDLPLVSDQRQGCGPLMGIYSGLCKIKQDVAFVCAADMPFLDKELIRSQYLALGKFDIVVPWPDGKPEFLHAFYSKRCLSVMQKNLDLDNFKIEKITESCKTKRLDQDWFIQNGFAQQVERGFTNINTVQDYRRWIGPADNEQPLEVQGQGEALPPPLNSEVLQPDLSSATPEVLQRIRRYLIQQESAYHYSLPKENYASLWSHSARVGRIAYGLAIAEKMPVIPAQLAGLLHDTGKFSDGKYHDDNIAEEEHAARFAKKVLAGTPYERWTPIVSEAILTMYLEGEKTTDIGRVIYDADNLDKLGHMGVAQFFSKSVFRRRFLGDGLIVRAGIELTYAHHAPDTLKTVTGRSRAQVRKMRTYRFYTELLEEWEQLGLGTFNIQRENIAGIDCILVVPKTCSCGGRFDIHSDIEDALKCRSLIVSYTCSACAAKSEVSFCLPNIKGLPPK